MAKLLKTTAYYALPVMLFIFFTLVIIVNCIALVVILQKRRQEVRHLTRNSIVMDLNTKLTRATMITLVIYIMLYLPGVILTSIGMLVHHPDLSSTQDVAILLHFRNNLVNPFTYCSR